MFVVALLVKRVVSSGPELVQELHGNQSWVLPPAAGLSVVPVGSASQLPSSPDLPAWTQRQVSKTHLVNFNYLMFGHMVKHLFYLVNSFKFT